MYVRKETDPLTDEVELLEVSPHYAHIPYPDGREDTVSTRHLSPTSNEPSTLSPDTADAARGSSSPEAVNVGAHDSGL